MSSHEDSSAGADDHGSHDHEIFDAQPVTELADGEPTTPMWLPLLGACLFVVFGIYLAFELDEGAASRGSAASSAAVAAASGSAPKTLDHPGLRAAAKAGTPPRPQSPALSASPEQIKRIRENLLKARQEARAKGRAGAPPAPRPPAAQPPAPRPAAPRPAVPRPAPPRPPAPKAPAPKAPAPKAPAPKAPAPKAPTPKAP